MSKKPTVNKSRMKRYRALYEKLGMSQRGAAHFLDMGERSSRRWASGQLEVPLAIMMLLEVMDAYGITPEQARTMAHATQRKPTYADQRYPNADE